MQVIKAIKPVRDHQVVIDLPKNFLAQEVEVFVIPYHFHQVEHNRDAWQDDFRSISQWDVTEEDVRITSWPLEELS